MISLRIKIYIGDCVQYLSIIPKLLCYLHRCEPALRGHLLLWTESVRFSEFTLEALTPSETELGPQGFRKLKRGHEGAVPRKGSQLL